MLTPATLDLTVQRNAPFPDGPDHRWTVKVNGSPLSLTSKVILMQVRQYEGEPGDPLIDLSSATGSGDRIEIIGNEWEIHIAQATLEAIPSPALNPSNKPLTLYYDLLIGPSGSELVYLKGKFVLVTGVTR